MKKLLSLASLAFCLFSLNACEQPASTNTNPIFPLSPGTGVSTVAQPTICGIGSKVVDKRGTVYYGISVTDTDGNNLSQLYSQVTPGLPSTVSSPTWSPTGTSVSFRDGSNIKRFDVTVVNGVATASNLMTISTSATSVGYVAWSSTAAVNKIAYTTGGIGGGQLWVVPAAGGNPTLVYQDTVEMNIPLWSPDDQQIAIRVRYPRAGLPPLYAMRIIDVATGTVVSENVGPARVCDPIKWTRTGANKILLNYGVAADASDVCSYSADVITGARTLLLTGGYLSNGTWSPRNDKILYSQGGDTKAINPSTLAITTIKFGTSIGKMDWKK